ncbi:MAG: response regulator, partial [Myxococcaceae bacterium]
MPDSRYTLLLVDDEASVLEILTRTFERKFNVLSASAAPEALELLKTHSVDLLLTDQKMPDMTGIELVTAARQAGIDVTAILLTAYTNPEDLIAAINQGQVYRYVTKPWDVHELMMTVNNALESVQLRRDRDRLMRQLEKRVRALSVLYEVTHQSASDAPTYDAIIERVLSAIARVLPYDCGAALVAVDEGKSATLRLRCAGEVGENGLLWAKDTVLAQYRKHSGLLLPEDRVITRVTGAPLQDAQAPSTFASQINVTLTAAGRPVGTLSLFSRLQNAYSSEDAQLLDVLANQTTDSIQSLRAHEDEGRRRIERMVESMADGVLLTDEKNEVVVINPAAKKLLHLSDDPRELTARHLQETLGFYPFELVRGWEYGGAQVLREELKLFDKTVQSTVTPVPDGRGVLKGVVVVLRDITDQKQLEERKDEFVSIVSHELRTPLTAISGALDIVLNNLCGDINDKQQRYLSMAKESTEKLNAIVDDLLDLSKFAKGRLKMSFEVTWLDELVRKGVEQYGPSMLRKDIRVQAEVPEKPLKILSDPNRLGQVLNNLLTNAVKFTPDTGEIRVELKASDAMPGYVSLSIWNSGEPIADSDLERIFDRFEQARNSRTRTVRGTGLGLAICRNIVEAHGGRIWAERQSIGARFVVVLPVEPPQDLLLPDGPPPEKLAAMTLPAGPKKTVVVVEDEPEIAWVVKATLLARNYDVVVARNAEEGLQLGRRFRPDCIVLDVRLPDIDGLSLAEIFRHDPETRSAPLLVM